MLRGFILRVSENTPAPRRGEFQRLRSAVSKLLRNNKIMDFTKFALLVIFSVFLFGVRETTSWRTNEDRPDSYDLQRGPVFYEAYYPDEEGLTAPGQQQIPSNTQTERRYTDRGNILERTYQSLENSSPYQQNPREFRNQREFIGNYGSFRDTANESYDPNNANVQVDKVAQQVKRIVENVEHDTNLRNSGIYALRGNSATNYKQPYLRRNYGENLNNYPDRRYDDSIVIISSAIKNGALEISKEGLARLIQNKEEITKLPNQDESIGSNDFIRRSNPSVKNFEGNFDPTKRSAIFGPSILRDREESWRNNLDRGGNDRADLTAGDDYDDVRGPMSGMAFRRMENIFQPRPQVISYVFSQTRNPKRSISSTSMSDLSQGGSIHNNEKPTSRDGNNLVNSKIKKETPNSNGMSAGVASIEVSEVTHHKIRHHHGEKPRRNHHHRQTATGN